MYNGSMRPRILFILILLFACFVRLYHLGTIPAGVTNDEATYIYSAYSIWKTGHDFAGKFLPLSFNLAYSYSPVPVYIIAPFVGLYGMNLVTGRLPFALVGIGSVVLVYFLAKLIFRRNDLAFLSMAIAAVSPWSMFFSRIAYEAGFALFFFLLGIVLFISGVKKGKMLWSLLPFLLGFYSYHATKIFFIIFVPFLLVNNWQDIIRYKRVLAWFILGFVGIIASFIFVTKTQGVNRTDILLWNDSKTAARYVNWAREKSTAPMWMRSIASNKPLYFLRIARENYLEAFSPQFLFLYGETSGLAGLYGIMSHGMLYLIELPLLLIGIYTLIHNRNNRRAMFFLLGGLLIGPLPSAVGADRSYAVRSIMMQPFLLLITAYGGYTFVVGFKRYRPVLVRLLVVLYAVFVVSYLHEYFYRFPIYYAESWFGSTRDVISLIDKNKDQYDSIIVANHGDPLFQYGFFHAMDPTELRILLSQPYPRIVGNVSFVDECLATDASIAILPPKTLYLVPERCHKHIKPSFEIVDRGEPLRVIWKGYTREVIQYPQ